MNKIFIFCIIVLSFFGCSNKKPQLDLINEAYDQDNNKLAGNTEISTIEEKEQLNIGEEKLEYWGTVYNSFINDDNVNVRSYPSLNADILFKVNKNTKIVITGVSKEIDDIDNYTGNWLNIKIENPWGDGGWVFSKYIKNGLITASEIKIIALLPKEEHRGQGLIGSQKINGIERQIILSPHKMENQDFYTFAYDWSIDFFHYSNIPGSYAWFPKTNELKHITYIGTDMESGWSVFTDDFKYVLQDFGTSTGPRLLGVWRVEDGKEIFSGTYYHDIKLNGNTINIAYVYDNWNISHNRLDDEILIYCKEFKKNNPEPDDMVNISEETGFGLTLIIICELNLDTGIRSIINGQYIYAQ
ncbi:MAG: SH3 domain-containing protein [Treponema sp.]|jgi:hypothetical protein|nr:SH3 domain-containing protein [Treponema sp.]